MSFYPLKINQRFAQPENAGKIDFPSAVGSSGSFVCGAALKIFLLVRDGKIVQARFKAAGCGFLFAAADFLCERIENKEFAEVGRAMRAEKDFPAAKFQAEFQNEFPPLRQHCFELCLETLRAAIDDFRAARLENRNGDEALICTCFGVSETTIETAVRENSLTSVEEVIAACRAGGGCGSCQALIIDILDDALRDFV